jgi:hypothetical protein
MHLIKHSQAQLHSNSCIINTLSVLAFFLLRIRQTKLENAFVSQIVSQNQAGRYLLHPDYSPKDPTKQKKIVY